MSDTIHATATPRPSAASPPTSDRSLRAFRIFSYCIAALLLTTAILKNGVLFTDPFADLVTQTPLRILWLSVFVEISAAFILISQYSEEIEWGAAFSLFFGFTLIGCLKLHWRHETCRCLGRIELKPIYMIAMDIGVLSGLCSFRKLRQRSGKL
jgi:hypothetical protein